MNPIIPKTNSAPGAGAPASLYLGELATNRSTGKLYLGCDGGVQEVGNGTVGSQISSFTGDGSATAFSPVEGYSTNDAGSYLVSVGGIDQRPTTDWTISSANGGTITFASAPPNGAPIVARAFIGTGTPNGNATLLQGRAMADTAPNNNDALTWNTSASQWEPSAVVKNQAFLPNDSFAIGPGASVPYALYGLAVGIGATANGSAVALGTSTNADFNGIAIGFAQSAATNEIKIGGYGMYTVTIGEYSLGAIKEKINEIITWANTAGASITPL
jgi:hypothetical protein